MRDICLHPAAMSDKITPSLASAPIAQRRISYDGGVRVLQRRPALRDILLSSRLWLLALALACVVLLVLPMRLAIGGYYWDTFLYPDAAWRIANGQIPHVDFFAPAGALAYYSYAALDAIFPSGQQLLLAQWSVLLVALPLAALMTPDIERHGRYLALAVILPFVFFAFVPLNSKEVYPLAGVDGFGVYNRHVCLLLYLLVASFMFVPSGRKLALMTGLNLTALFFIKVTGALVAAPIIGLALLTGRLQWRNGLQALVVFVVFCVALELPSGMVSAYLRDIGILVGMNADGLISRLRGPLVMYLDILCFLGSLALLLMWIDRKRLLFLLSPRAGMRMGARIAALCNHDAVWIGVLTCAGILFETQNTGSLALIFLWPFLATVFARWFQQNRSRRTAVLLLIALAVAPMIMPMLHRAARVTLATAFYDDLDAPALGRHGHVEARPELLVRARAVKEHMARAKELYLQFSQSGHQSSYLLYSEIDYQLSWLIGVNEAIEALRDLELSKGRIFERLIVLDFVDLFTPVLQRTPVRLTSIGMAAERTVPPLVGERLAEAHRADALLVPRCPATPVRLSLLATFAPVMEGRSVRQLSDCWDLVVRDESSSAPRVQR